MLKLYTNRIIARYTQRFAKTGDIEFGNNYLKIYRFYLVSKHCFLSLFPENVEKIYSRRLYFIAVKIDIERICILISSLKLKFYFQICSVNTTSIILTVENNISSILCF